MNKSKSIVPFVFVVAVAGLLIYQAGLKGGYKKGLEISNARRKRAHEVVTLYGQHRTRGTLGQRVMEGVTDAIGDIALIWEE
jgi:hypothetical protein